MNSKTKLISILAVIAFIGLGVWGFKWMQDHPVEATLSEREEVVPVVEVIEVAAQDYQVEIQTEARVRAKRSSQLVAELAGKVVEVAPQFELGGIFEQGETVLRIDPSDYQNAVERAEAAMTEAATALKLEQARAEQAGADWKRLRGDVPASELTLRKPQIAAAQARLASAKALLEQAKLDLQRTTIVAPYDCRISAKSTELGSYVVPGQVMLSIFSLNEREATVSIPLNELGFLQEQAGKFVGGGMATDQVGGRELSWPVQIVRGTGRVGELTLGEELVVEFAARADSGSGLEGYQTPPPGSFVKISLVGKTLQGVYRLPRRSLLPDDRMMIFREGKLAFIDVDVLRKNNREVLVGSGLGDGDEVIISSIEVPIAGMKIKREIAPQSESD